MRFRKYKCPENGSCSFPWLTSLDSSVKCSYCGVSSKEMDTIFDKIEDIYWSIVPFKWRPKQVLYYLECFFFRRYTTVKPRTLDHGWCDAVDLIPHVLFEMLTRFVEDEVGVAEMRSSEEPHNVELLRLYDWWKNEWNDEYPYNLTPIPENAFELEEENRNLLLSNCKKIIDLSPVMWT